MENETIKRLKQKKVQQGDLVLVIDESMGISLGFFHDYEFEDTFRLKDSVHLYPTYKSPLFEKLSLPKINVSSSELNLFDHICYNNSEIYAGKQSIIEQLNSRKGFELYAKMLEGEL